MAWCARILLGDVMAGLVDVHAHLIPGVDDGCMTLEDSIACGRAFVAAGYERACCTPHIWPQFPHNTAANIRRQTAELQAAYTNAGIDLRLTAGGEINLESNWPSLRLMQRDEIVSYGFQGKYILFDFWAQDFPDYLLPGIEYLQGLGFTLIMAHPERLKVFHRNVDLIERVEKMGVLLQCNSWCLMDSRGTPNRDVSERLLKDRRYFMLGTDTHNFKGLQIRLDGIERARDLVGEAYVQELTVANPLKVVGP
jgi:protein-tyrosine phosphatase